MSFVVYDLTFLVLFCIFVVVFLYKNRKKLGKESMLGIPIYLYRTQWGVNLIKTIGKKYSRALHIIKYISITVGFILMAAMIYLLGKTVWIYATVPQITQIIKAPPVAPLIPYFPQLFGVQSFFPPFYFTYFLLAIVIVAVVHEFSHGIYMKLFGMKIKATGFAFFGPILGAFVEEDKGQMNKGSNIAQMSVLSAGVFANIVFALIFFLLLVGFFYLAFQPAGYQFNTYSYSFIPVSLISGYSNLSNGLTAVNTTNGTYFLDNTLKLQLQRNLSVITAYDDAPAIAVGLKGAITEVSGQKIAGPEDLRNFLINSSPGQNITIKTETTTSKQEYNITLAANPVNNSIGYIGVGFLQPSSSGIVGKFVAVFTFYKQPSIYYSPRIDGEFVIFISDLLWWIMIINFFVGLFNMLPLGALDGGRFFYIGVLSITKNKKVSTRAFKIASMLIGLIFIAMIFFWLISFI